MQVEELLTLVFVIGMAAGVLVVYLGLRQRTELLEMQHRERLAMIERGQVPLTHGPALAESHRAARRAETSRSTASGIIVVGFGIALAMAIGLAGENVRVGIGLGGAIAVLGGAFIIKGLVVRPAAVSHAPVGAEPSSIDSARSE